MRHVRDVPYGADSWQQLDLYLPDDTSAEAMPTLLFMHGGYWTHGHKEWLGFMAPPLASLPALFISVGYRLAPDTPYPGPVEDCVDALAWAYRHVAEYGGDPQRLFVGGHSAGGHLAALMALQPERLTARGLPADLIKACFPVSGVYDLAGDIPQDRLQAFLPQTTSPAEASPLHYVHGNRTPFFLAIGAHDFPVLSEQAFTMAALLRREAGPVEFLEVPEADHFHINMRQADPDDPWVQRVRAWMHSPPQGKPLTL
jgi:acetyl esterase/lipase